MKKLIHKIITLFILLTGVINVTHAESIAPQKQRQSVTPEKYAVIINAESDCYHNRIRYWNDCSAIYQTLLIHSFPSSNIFVAMSGGTNPDDDILFCTPSPLDLDGDSNNDIQYAATLSNIEYIFDSLSRIMTYEDELFIYTVGEGRVDTFEIVPQTYPYIYEPIYTSYLVLWGGEDYLTEQNLATMLVPIHARTINIVMQQSHSGGFIEALSGLNNVVITTACGVNEKSYAMNDQKYDEFTYHWISAVNGFSPFYLYPYYQIVSSPDDADENQDGYVTMYEAYNYIYGHKEQDEYARINSNPDCLKYSLSLDALLDCLLIPGWDLYMKDNSADTGEEPNNTTEEAWITDNIWFEKDGQKTDNIQSGETYNVCVKIQNRGIETSPGDAALCVHWTKATIGGAWPWGWYGEYTYNCSGHSVRRGDMIDSIVLPPIAGGGEYVARIPWTTPDVEEYLPCFGDFGNNTRELMHFCILARIVDAQEQPDRSITNLNHAEFVLFHNNVVSRNIIIMTVQNDAMTDGVDITNPLPGQNSGPYSLRCQIVGEDDWEQLATVNLTFDSQFIAEQSSMTYLNCHANNSYEFELEDGALFEDIYFSATDNGTYPSILSVEYYDTYDFYPEFTIYLVLQDWNGNVINGEKFKFKNNRPDLANVIKRPTHTDEPENDIERQPVIQENGSTIDVYNAQGMHMIHCDNCNVQSLNLPEGIYIYRIQGENESYTKKVIK